MSVLIIGAHGQIGQLLTQELVRSGETPKAMVRDESQAETLRKLGAEPVIADLEEDFSPALKGCDQVVFAAGSGAKTGPDKTILVDMWGAMKAVDAAKAASVKHFVMVSSRGTENPDAGPTKIKHYVVCKKLADDHLIQSGLAYTILRSGRLTNDSAVGTVSTERPDSEEDQWIPRADVAHAIAYCLKENDTLNRIYPLFTGNQSLNDALIK